MELGALAPYETALRTAGPLALQTATGRQVALDVARWLGPADAADLTVVRRCEGPVLDVGCGPGRFVSSLHARGIFTLGVDIAETAVELTRGMGMPALLRSVFGALPGEGRWATVLLLDGNVGIGGDPVRLLNRVATLLAPGGRLIVETSGSPEDGRNDDLDDGIPDALGAGLDGGLVPDEETAVQTVRFTEGGAPVGPEFDWAVVSERSLLHYAARTGYRCVESWSSGGRTFVVLAR